MNLFKLMRIVWLFWSIFSVLLFLWIILFPSYIENISPLLLATTGVTYSGWMVVVLFINMKEAWYADVD